MISGKIVIASVLKPVDDTRSFEKFGLSLSQTNNYDVNIIGFCSKKSISHPKISFHPVFNFHRKSFKRLFSSWKYYKILLKVKPDLIIVSSPELLPVTLLYKILFGTKISYDVQENYYANIRFTTTYLPGIRTILASGVRTLERLSRAWIDLYLLAEKCYVHELPFTKGKSVVVQNKFMPLKPIKPADPCSKLPLLRLLYTGTITQSYGILEAVCFTKNISILHPQVELRILGHTPDPGLHRTLLYLEKKYNFLNYQGDLRPIPHQTIINAVSEADFALLPYQPDKSIENCFPTKIWEYMAHKLPMIIQDHKPWADYCRIFQAFIAIDYQNYDPKHVLQQLLTTRFYSTNKKNDFFWETEELTFLHAIKQL